MRVPAERYQDWKAPAEDGQLLLWPDARTLLRDTESNHAALAAASVTIQGIALADLRKRQREAIGHRDSRLLISTGHQTELFHPGVWVKDALIDTAARKAGGQAIHFAVDSDAPKHLFLKWPGGGEPITDDPNLNSAEWSALLKPPSADHLQRIAGLVESIQQDWHFKPMLDPYLAALRRLSMESDSLSSAITHAGNEVDRELGLKHQTLITSTLWLNDPYLVFVHHMLANADKVASDYNAALEAFRISHGIDNPGRPMPNLTTSADACECPFWLDNLTTGHRERCTVKTWQGGWRLSLDESEYFVFDRTADGHSAAVRLASWLQSHNRRLAPRALTLTMFLRLFVVDQFVHGIGGGRYDQVTDDFIHRHFRIDPPRFSVTTATLYFPGAAGRSRTCLPCILQEGHRLKHNILGPAKQQYVAQIAAAPRKSLERSQLFAEMHRQRKSSANDPAIRQWEQKLSQARQQAIEDESIFNRELFYLLQPRDRLTDMIQRYAAAFA